MNPSSRETNVPRRPLSRSTRTPNSSTSNPSPPPPPPPRPPVIIYTQSPKIIHTPARDFKALVQKLTGLPQSTGDDDDDSAAATNNPPPAPSNIPCKDANTMHAANDDSSSSSENLGIAGKDVHHEERN